MKEMTKSKRSDTRRVDGSAFPLCHSFVLRHSSFVILIVIRHCSHAP
jgi:hypothetical protein